MTDKYHGYYIHGKAPWSKSDLPMSWLKMELDMESNNRRKPRTLGTDAAKDALSGQFETNTYEIFLQPAFRDNFDAWKDTPLEAMDNRNLSEKERAALEDTKKAILAQRTLKKDKNAVREAEDLDDEDEQGLTPKE